MFSSEDPVFDIAVAYQRTAALVAAVKLDIFSIIGAETMSADQLANRTGCALRGMRILCDYLSVIGFLKKQNLEYSLTHVSRVFLDSSSSFAKGKIVDFVATPEIVDLFLHDPVSYVRKGGSVDSTYLSPDHPVWARFAQAMVPFAATNAKRIAAHVAAFHSQPYTVLDIAAGHGLYGIELAKAMPQLTVTIVDWAPVLALAQANAEAAGVADRFRMIAGNAIELNWGRDYDLILLTNFLHHFDFDSCTSLLRKARLSLAADGRLLAVDFVPNEDRISPPIPAMFAFWMLATTPCGDAYTVRDLSEMATNAGFQRIITQPLGPGPQTLITFEH